MNPDVLDRDQRESDSNPYAIPQSQLDVPATTDDPLLFVVAPRKFLFMVIGTAGSYTLYWFYRNWAMLNRLHRQYWPIPRAIFSIFFTHSLFNEVEHLRVQRGRSWTWQPGLLATIYVMSIVLPALINNLALADNPVLGLMIGFVFWIPMAAALYRAQLAINVAEGDPDGRGNRRITGLNVVWLLLGALIWLSQIVILIVASNPSLLER